MASFEGREKKLSGEYTMWLIIFAVSILIGIAGALYLAGKLRRTGIFSQIKSTAAVTFLSAAAVALFAFVLVLVFDTVNMIIIVVHVAVFLLLGDLLRFIAGRFFGKEIMHGTVDAIALFLCVITLAAGWILMHGLWETDYSLFTEKKTGHIRMAHIADSHIGTGFSGKEFGKKLERIQSNAPDILVITGDFVDDSTIKDDMVSACAALSDFKTKYGIYFCVGNHDLGYYGSEHRGYSGQEFLDELRKNGVIVLEDESVLIDDRFYVTGRLDADYGRADRLDIKSLVSGLDKEKYIVVLDHQPTDYEAEAAAGVDLVLSGHTHGGQLFPLEYIQPLVSKNNNVRGYKRIGGTDFIVTDGISDWAVKFRTGCRSEYNIIDIEGR